MGAWQRAPAAGCAVALAFAMGGTAFADPEAKMDRQIELFERILDDVFVESPYWLVHGQHESRGRYRAGEGAVFTIDASLVDSNRWGGKWWGRWGDWDDKHVVIIQDDDDEDDDSKTDREKRRSVAKKWMDRELKREERLYSRGKAELVDAFLDYGEVLSAVPDGESLTIRVDLGDAELFDEKDVSDLMLKAKMADIRAFADGKLDEKTMVQRIQVQES